MTTTFIFYHYTPSLAAAIIFIILFSAVTLIHVVQLARFRAWFTLPVVIGGVFETTAYIGRAVSHSSSKSLVPYIIQSLLSLIAPALFAATIYMTLGRIIRHLHAERHCIIKVAKLTTVFVSFDALSFLIQCSGAGLQVGRTASSVKTGQSLVLVALFLQIIIFAFFVVVAVVFQRRVSRQPTQDSQRASFWKGNMGGLYAASALILLRNLVRVVEYIQGYDGYIKSNEWFLYTFDAVPMFAVMVLMVVIYAPSLFKYGEGGDLEAAELQPEGFKQMHHGSF